MRNIKTITASLGVGIILATSVSYAWNATWNGTGWITNGGVINAQKIAENFEYLKAQVQSAGVLVKSGTSAYYTGGNFGLGTSTPGQLLELYKDNADVAIRFHDPNTAWYSMGIDSSDGAKFKINYGGNVGDAAHFTMMSNGNVGIGTTAPSNKLEVAGKVEADSYCDRNGQNCTTAAQMKGVSSSVKAYGFGLVGNPWTQNIGSHTFCALSESRGFDNAGSSGTGNDGCRVYKSGNTWYLAGYERDPTQKAYCAAMCLDFF